MSTTHTVYECGRCGATETSPPHNGPRNWFPETDWTDVTLTPSKLHSETELFVEMCPDCSRALRAFLAMS